MTITETVTPETKQAFDYDIAHITCCYDDKLALCSAPVNGKARPEDFDCIECERVHNQEPEFCPKFNFCMVKDLHDDN